MATDVEFGVIFFKLLFVLLASCGEVCRYTYRNERTELVAYMYCPTDCCGKHGGFICCVRGQYYKYFKVEEKAREKEEIEIGPSVEAVAAIITGSVVGLLVFIGICVILYCDYTRKMVWFRQEAEEQINGRYVVVHEEETSLAQKPVISLNDTINIDTDHTVSTPISSHRNTKENGTNNINNTTYEHEKTWDKPKNLCNGGSEKYLKESEITQKLSADDYGDRSLSVVNKTDINKKGILKPNRAQAMNNDETAELLPLRKQLKTRDLNDRDIEGEQRQIISRTLETNFL